MTDTNEPTNKGVLKSAAFTFAAVYILTEEKNHYVDNFTHETLPKILSDLLPDDAEGVMITATIVSKSGDNYMSLSDKEFAGITLNKMITFFGKREN
jgi:hypothetical protein